jgi:hypothetical protein
MGPGRSVVIDVRELKRASFNSNNGLWIIRFKDGRRVRFQSAAGAMLSADRSEAGRATNDVIRRCWSSTIRHFGV